MATLLDILLLAALIVATIKSHFKIQRKKRQLVWQSSIPVAHAVNPRFYGTLVTQDPEPQNNHRNNL